MGNIKINSLPLILSLLIYLAFADCSADYFPVYSGGRRAEVVTCFAYDDVQELIIVGGESNSDDYVGFNSGLYPNQTVHGFLYALDLDGNWQWGKFYYNATVAVSNITGCQMASHGQSLSVLGMSNTSVPVIMDIRTRDGTINKFTFLNITTTLTSIGEEE